MDQLDDASLASLKNRLVLQQGNQYQNYFLTNHFEILKHNNNQKLISISKFIDTVNSNFLVA